MITSYNVVCDPGEISVAGSAPPIVVTGLANDTSYSCTVRATNVAGTGAPSTPIAAIPEEPGGHRVCWFNRQWRTDGYPIDARWRPDLPAEDGKPRRALC